MRREDVIVLVLLVVGSALLAHSAFRVLDSSSIEAELSGELKLLNDESVTSSCAGQPGCESATWKLTLETKRSETYRSLLAVHYNKNNGLWEGGLTIFALLFIFLFYPELRAALFARFGGLRQPEVGLKRE